MISDLSTATPAVTQERGGAGATTEEDTLDGIPWHCESGGPLSMLRMHVALASQVGLSVRACTIILAIMSLNLQKRLMSHKHYFLVAIAL